VRFQEALVIKESLCYVAENYAEEVKDNTTSDYELPDGTVITVGSYFREILQFRNLFPKPLIQLKEHSVVRAHIQVTEGTSRMTGFFSRVSKELTKEDVFAAAELSFQLNPVKLTWDFFHQKFFISIRALRRPPHSSKPS
jgi:hypothetical protein